jgi:hypothetical protein
MSALAAAMGPIDRFGRRGYALLRVLRNEYARAAT